jgi:AraC family transcriptional activator of pobA
MTTAIPVHTLAENENSALMVRRMSRYDGIDMEERHRHNYYEILLFDQAGGTNMIDFEEYEVQAQSIHFISPGQVHALNRNKETDGYLVTFTKDFMALNGGNLSMLNDFPAFAKTAPAVLQASTTCFAGIFELVTFMEKEVRQIPHYKEALLAAYIQALLIKCKALIVDTVAYRRNDESAQQLIQRFNQLLEQHFTKFHKVNEYADQLGLTPNHLSDSLKKISGKTAGELIHQRIILEAKRLLLHSSLATKEIAYQLGFNDPSYFSRFFKANTGASPESFRKEVRQAYQ